MAADSAAVTESTDPSPPPEASARRPAPWRGRRRTEEGEAKDEWIGLRVTAADLDADQGEGAGGGLQNRRVSCAPWRLAAQARAR